MSYDKYKKIKDSTKKSGVKACDDYIDDEKKTQLVQSIKAIDEYAENDMKTVNPKNFKHLVSGINCKADEFAEDCSTAEQYYHATKSERVKAGQTANQAFHFINSYPGHPDPELVHKAGVELAKRLCGDEFYGKVCTHLNTDNYHNHIIVGAYSIDGTHKFRDEWHLYRRVRQIANEISMELGLDVMVAENTERLSWSESYKKMRFDSIMSATKKLKEDINVCRKDCPDFDEYKRRMEELGWTVTEKKNIISYAQEGTILSDAKLGNRYRKVGIEETISQFHNSEMRKILAAEVRKNIRNRHYAHYNDWRKIYVPRYSADMVRNPAIVRFLLYIKEIIRSVGDIFLSPMVVDHASSYTYAASSKQKIQMINDAIDLCNHYQIKTMNQLQEELAKAGLTAKAKDVEAIKFYHASENVASYAELLKDFGDLSTIMVSLGITNDMLKRKNYSPYQIQKNLAELDPVDGRTRKKLMQMLGKSEYGMTPATLYSLSRSSAKKVLDYLKGDTTEKPDLLLSKEEAIIATARDNCLRRLSKRNQHLAAKFHKDLLTPKQYQYIQKYFPEYLEQDLKKDQGIRLIGLDKEDRPAPIPEYVTEKEPPISEYLLDSFHDLVLLFPEIQKLDVDKLTLNSATALSDYYLSKLDNQEDIIHNRASSSIYMVPEQPPLKAIDFQKFSKEERAFISQYQNLLEICDRFGLDSQEKIKTFCQRADILRTQADELSAASRDAGHTYKELKRLQRFIEQSRDVKFLYGLLSEENEETKQAVGAADAYLSSDLVDNLQMIKDNVTASIQQLKKDQPAPYLVSDDAYTPADPSTIQLINHISSLFPGYLDPDLNLKTISDYQALHILESFEASGMLEKELEKEAKKEEKQDQIEAVQKEAEQEKEKKSFLNR